MKYLGVDIGSTYIKFAVVDPQDSGICDVHSVSAVERLPAGNPRCFEYDAKRYVEIVRGQLEKRCVCTALPAG